MKINMYKITYYSKKDYTEINPIDVDIINTKIDCVTEYDMPDGEKVYEVTVSANNGDEAKEMGLKLIKRK